MMKKLVLASLVLAGLLGIAGETEARCGRFGLGKGRLRTWISNHRPHLFHR